MNEELPQGWVQTALGAVVEAPRSKASPADHPDLPFVGMDHIAANGMQLLGAGRFGDMKSAGGLFSPGDVLYGRMRPYLNKVHVANQQGACSAEFIVLPQNAAIASGYLAYLLHHRKFVNFASAQSSGDRPRVDFESLSSYEFALPPKAEQARIVSKVDELFSDIEEGERALERVQKLVERYRQSVLKATVTGELTREWREKHKGLLESGEVLLQRILEARREAWEKAELAKLAAAGQKPANDKWKLKYEEPPSPTTDELPNLPPHWVWASVDQLTMKITSGSRDWKGFYGRGDGVFIMAQNVRPRRLDLSAIQRVDPPSGDRDANRSEVNQHDLLVTIVGANTGDICRVTEPLTKHYVCQSVALMRPVLAEAAPFIELFLCADEGGQAQFAKEAYGAGRPHLSFDQLRATCIPLPPLEEQVEICDAVNRIESDIKGMLAAAGDPVKVTNGLKQAVLRAAFSGTLVQQDATDEPASALLGRLRDHAPPSRNSPASAPAAPRPSRSRKS